MVDFTLPGHWRNTVFIFTIDFITFLDSGTALFCSIFAAFLFAVLFTGQNLHSIYGDSTRLVHPNYIIYIILYYIILFNFVVNPFFNPFALCHGLNQANYFHYMV